MDPDRFLSSLRKRILAFYVGSPEKGAAGVAERLVLRTEVGDVARAAALDGVVRHLLIVTDPSRRAPETPGEELDPGVIDRKARPTEQEKRWRDRREPRQDPPVPPPPQPPR